MPRPKKSAVSQKKSPAASTPQKQRGMPAARAWYARQRQKLADYLARRPHRSFQRTRRRDYVRSLRLPGYWAMTFQVRQLLWQNKRLFLYVALTYVVMTAMLVGLGSQSTYEQLSETLRTTSGEIFKGNWGEIGKASLLLTTTISGGLNVNLTDVQRIYGAIVVLMTWLTTVWLLRAVMAGKKPRMRDGLYASGAPIIATFLVGLVAVIQLIPMAIAVIGISAGLPTGVLDSGVLAMLLWVTALLLSVLSLYWVSSTILALVVVTLPGMYPLRAIKTAGDLAIGRRTRILLRLLWLIFTTVLIWLVVMVPVILFDAWIKSIFPILQPAPLVPIALLVMTSVSTIWSAAYVYFFYRKVVDDDAAPA